MIKNIKKLWIFIENKNASNHCDYWLSLVAGGRLELPTFGLWAQRAANCSIPRYIKIFDTIFYLLYARFIKNITFGRQMDGKNNFLLYYNFLYKIYNACKYYASWWLVSSASLTDFWVMSPTSCQLLHPAIFLVTYLV